MKDRHAQDRPRTGAAAHRASARWLARLWFGFLGAAVAWLVHLFVAYLLVGYACESGVTFLIHAASALLLALAVLSGWVSRTTWIEVGRASGGDAAGTLAGSRWLAFAGMLAGAWFAVVIVAQWLPVFLIPPCR